jgi:hypothetical protein
MHSSFNPFGVIIVPNISGLLELKRKDDKDL